MMLNMNVLASRHQMLVEHFADLAGARGGLPVFALEHGLDAPALEELRKAAAANLELDQHLTAAAWSWSYLPLLVIATEAGYRYRGTGTDFWPVLARELGIEAGQAFRSRLARLFQLGHEKLGLARPGDSSWERHFPLISWPIGNAVVPIEVQPQLADALRRAVRAGVSAADADMLLDHITGLAAGHASRRFENWLLQRDLALEVMRRLLAPGSVGWLSESLLARIDRDIRKDWGAFRAITEARKTVARHVSCVNRMAPALYGFSLNAGVPEHSFVRGPVLPARLRDEAIVSLRIHGDRIRAVGGVQAVPLGLFLSGGEIWFKNAFPFAPAPLRRDDGLDTSGELADRTMALLQPQDAEFFLVEEGGLTARAVFGSERLRLGATLIQCLGAGEDGNPSIRTLDTALAPDAELLRRHGYVVDDRAGDIRLIGIPAAGAANTFIEGFPVLAARRRGDGEGLLVDGAGLFGEKLEINGVAWAVLRPDAGHHAIEAPDDGESARLEFAVVEPPDVEPAAVRMFPVHADVSDLGAGQIEIRISAPLALEDVAVRIRVTAPDGGVIVSEGVMERLPATLTGRSPVLHAIQTGLAGLLVEGVGLQMAVKVEGVLEKVFAIRAVRRELRYDGDTGKWTGPDEDGLELNSIGATVVAPLLGVAEEDTAETRLILPDAPDHEALTAGIILSGRRPVRLGPGEGAAVSLPALLREPASGADGVGLTDLARAYVAWQLAGPRDLLGNWQRWGSVEILEGALIGQLCGPEWRKLESGIDLSILSPHGALLRSAAALGLVSGRDLPEVRGASDRAFLQDRLVSRLRDAVPDIPEALQSWSDDLAGDLDLAVIDAYEDLRQSLEERGMDPFEEVDMSRPAETWRKAFEGSRDMPLLPMFRSYILPDTRWASLIRPLYGELTEDDLVDLLDATHTDAFRRSGFRWLGRAELRTMLQLWLSPKAMVETEGWRDLLAKGLSDIRTARAVRYVALRRKLALRDLPDGRVG